MRKRNVLWIFLLIFLFTIIILYKYQILDSVIVTYASGWEKSYNQFKIFVNIVFSGVCSFVCSSGITGLTNLVKLYVDNRKDKERTAIDLSLKQDLTTIRKKEITDGRQIIRLGEGNRFVYVSAVLTNLGEKEIVKCQVNQNYIYCDHLSNSDSCEIRFQICKRNKEGFKKSYPIIVAVQNADDKCYQKELELTINENTMKAELFLKRKLKKRKTLK